MKTIRYLLLCVGLVSGIFGFSQEQAPGKAITESENPGYPVILRKDTLFHIRQSFGPFTAEERAKALSSRLDKIIRELDFESDSMKLVSTEDEYYIYYQDQILMVVGRKDTIGTGESMESLANTLVRTLQSSMSETNKSFNAWRIISNIGFTLLVVFVLLGIIWLLNRLFRRILKWMETNKERVFRSIKLNNYEFLTVEREYTLALLFLRVSKIILIILSFLIALPVIFIIFPATEGITRRIIQLVWGPFRDILLSVVNYIPELITLVVIYFIFKYIIRLFKFLSVEIEKGSLVLSGFHPDWAKPTFNIIMILLYAFMFVVMFPYLPGSDSPVFRGVSVFLGILISLGSTSLIGNAMAGLVITYMRPYKIGDRIKIDDVVGDVTEKTLMITRIRTIKNEDITIPNAKILTGYSINYSTPILDTEGLIVHTTVTIGYDAPWRTVHGLLIAAAEATAGVSKYPKPFVLQTGLDDFYISYQINAYVKDPHGVQKLKSELHQHIQDQFNKAGVEIMSPHYRSERDGNEITIPKDWEYSGPPENSDENREEKLSSKRKPKSNE